MISTLAGSGVEGTSTDGTGALLAALRAPRAVAVSAFGMPVFADRLNATVREDAGDVGLFQPAALVPGRSSAVSPDAAKGLSYGQQGSAAVAVSGQVGVPLGQVQVSEGSQIAGTASLTEGAAKLSLPDLSAGVHHLVSTYAGDGLNPGGSASFDVDVTTAAVTATASSGQVAYGAPFPTLSGVLSGVLPQDQGLVGVSFGIAAGQTPAVGRYAITASLTGPRAANYTVAMSPSSGALQVIKEGTSALLGSVGQSFAGLPMSLSATVSPATTGQPTGTVQFLDGSTVVATANLIGGTATATYARPPLGSRSLSVQYLGDSNFLPSTSQLAGVMVQALPDFAVAPSGPQSVSTAAGGTANYRVLVSSSTGSFTGAVSLSVTGLPAGASVNFSPPQVVPGNSSAVVTVAVQTNAGQTAAALGDARQHGGGTRVAVGLGLLCCLGWFRRKPRRRLSCLLGAALLLTGCGARTVGEGTGGVLAETYTLQVTGTATNLAGVLVTHATTLTLTVQQ